MTGFYHTHAGYWTVGHTSKGIKTRMECANNCTQNCVAFNTHALNTSSKGECYHYSNRSGLITENERLSERSKAYIKCLGNNEWRHSFKLCDLPYYVFRYSVSANSNLMYIMCIFSS